MDFIKMLIQKDKLMGNVSLIKPQLSEQEIILKYNASRINPLDSNRRRKNQLEAS